MRVDRKWHKEQIEEFAAVRPRYVTFADLMFQALNAAAGDVAPGAIVQARAKTLPSFAEKAVRKANKYRDPVEQLTDLCGVRVITQLPSEVERVSEFITSRFDVDWPNSQDVRMRLRATEFGYLSVHYVVRLREGVDLGVPVPKECLGLAAEIQVRTLLQHVWAAIGHDRLYKGGLKVPARWHRIAARLAAMLEDADLSFETLSATIDEYRTDHGAYMTSSHLDDELETLEAILASDPRQLDVRLRLARVARSGGRWDKVLSALGEHANASAAVQRELGRALCRRASDEGDPEDLLRGRELLHSSLASDPSSAEAAALLAASYRGDDDEKAGELYRRAFELDPKDPYLLTAFLEHELRRERTATVTALMRPMIDAAVARCETHASLGIHLPFAHFAAARLHLLADRSQECMDAWARGLAIALAKDSGVSARVLEGELRFLERIAGYREKLEGWEWSRRLLLCALKIAGGSPDLAALQSTRRIEPPPVVVLSTDGAPTWTSDLVSGAVAGLPIQRTVSATEGVEEMLQFWLDVLAAGVAPCEVRVLAAGGRGSAGLEYRVAAALGAEVGLVEGSGGEADRLASDPDWAEVDGILRLPSDPDVLRVFVVPLQRLAGKDRDVLGRGIHTEYRKTALGELMKRDPALRPWDELDAGLKESSCQQADDILAKLAVVGYTVQRGTPDELASPPDLGPEEVETLAKREHGRWTVERMRAHWTKGEKKDVERKISPFLVRWDELGEEDRDKDRDPVMAIPKLLASVGLVIRRK